MENPTYKLKGLVRNRENMEDFEGPLALILQLLSKNKIEIKDVKIALILEQYIEYLDKMEKMDLEIASEFVTMASHLMYIKAKTLLVGEEEAVTELEALIESLEAMKRRESYKKIKEVVEQLTVLSESGMLLFTKGAEVIPREEGYRYVHEAKELKNALLMMMRRERESGAIPDNFIIPSRLVYPVEEKTEEIMIRLRDKGAQLVREIFMMSGSRTELVASFMAILELCKSGGIILEEREGEYIARYNAREGGE